MSGHKKRFFITVVLWFIVFEGLGAILFLFSIPSMERNTLYFGFSKARLLLAITFLAVILFSTALAVAISVSSRVYNFVFSRIEVFIKTDTHYVNLLFTLIFWACIGVLAIAFLNSPLVPDQNPTKAIFLRGQSIVIWASLVCIQAAFVLRAIRIECTSNKVDYSSRELIRELLRTAFIQFTFWQWAILILNIPVFTMIKDWYWHFFERDLVNLWFFPFILVLAIAVGCLIFMKQTKVVISLVALMALGYLLQIGFGFMEGDGYQAIKDRYISGGRPVYAEVVSDSDFEFQDIFYMQYEGRGDRFLRTKPPGYLLLYAVIQEVFNPEHAGANSSSNLNILVNRMSVIFPFISVLIIPVIIRISKELGLEPEDGLLSAIVYIALPSMVLLTLQLDQVLIPLIFSAGVLLGIRTLRSKNVVLAFITGVYLYLALLLSYSLVMLIPMLFVYFSFNFTPLVKRSISASHYIRIIFSMSVGFLSLYALFGYMFNFELSSSFSASMSFHELSKGTIGSTRDFISSFFLNQAELIFWLSFPVTILFGMQYYETISQITDRRIDQKGVLFVVSQLVLLGLLLFGSTRGEVARLWIFIFPICSIFIASQLTNLFQQRYRASIYYLISILGTSLLILENQFPYQ